MRLWKFRDIKKYVPVTSATLSKWSDEGLFPEKIELSPRMFAWKKHEVLEWLDEKGIEYPEEEN
jgi:predicted DNA-binding transcriptional regulator AlpA